MLVKEAYLSSLDAHSAGCKRNYQAHRTGTNQSQLDNTQTQTPSKRIQIHMKTEFLFRSQNQTRPHVAYLNHFLLTKTVKQ